MLNYLKVVMPKIRVYGGQVYKGQAFILILLINHVKIKDLILNLLDVGEPLELPFPLYCLRIARTDSLGHFVLAV